MTINIICFIILFAVILKQQSSIHKINKKLNVLNHDNISKRKIAQKELKEMEKEITNSISAIIENKIEDFISNSDLNSKNEENLNKITSIEDEVYESDFRTFKLIVDIYNNNVEKNANEQAWLYIEDEEANSLELTYAGKVDMVRWLQSAFIGGVYYSEIHIFKSYYESYIKDKDYYKDDEESFINFMSLYIPKLKYALERQKEFDEMSHLEIWEKLAELGTKYNR
ncbi:TPA: hypothetical protein N3A45_000435 [Salmonella enterica subsp. salamae serovar [1],40:z35:e,n,x,z15]|nr:hypothetical protein [Salmonella enterica]HCM1997411.1 hypothetical protein [Salmonella enterica subsp. salamae serovar [1],40:z35:e,n,x,z15]